MSKLKTVVLGLDYFMFNRASDRRQADFDMSILAGTGNAATAALGYAKAYFSFDTLLSWARTVASQRPGLVAPLAHGMRGTVDYDKARERDGVRGGFAWVLRHFAQTAYLPPPRFQFTLEEEGVSSLESLREMLRLANERGIRLHLVVNPSHAWDNELMHALGLWEGFEQWKRALVRLVEEESRSVAATAQPVLWDFSGYNTITTEPVPDAGARATMKWYLDAQHFNQKTGDLVLDRVLGYADASRVVPVDFGVRLNSLSVEDVLAQTRQARASYVSAHPDDFAEVGKIAEAWRSEANSARGRYQHFGSARQ